MLFSRTFLFYIVCLAVVSKFCYSPAKATPVPIYSNTMTAGCGISPHFRFVRAKRKNKQNEKVVKSKNQERKPVKLADNEELPQ